MGTIDTDGAYQYNPPTPPDLPKCTPLDGRLETLTSQQMSPPPPYAAHIPITPPYTARDMHHQAAQPPKYKKLGHKPSRRSKKVTPKPVGMNVLMKLKSMLQSKNQPKQEDMTIDIGAQMDNCPQNIQPSVTSRNEHNMQQLVRYEYHPTESRPMSVDTMQVMTDAMTQETSMPGLITPPYSNDISIVSTPVSTLPEYPDPSSIPHQAFTIAVTNAVTPPYCTEDTVPIIGATEELIMGQSETTVHTTDGEIKISTCDLLGDTDLLSDTLTAAGVLAELYSSTDESTAITDYSSLDATCTYDTTSVTLTDAMPTTAGQYNHTLTPYSTDMSGLASTVHNVTGYNDLTDTSNNDSIHHFSEYAYTSIPDVSSVHSISYADNQYNTLTSVSSVTQYPLSSSVLASTHNPTLFSELSMDTKPTPIPSVSTILSAPNSPQPLPIAHTNDTGFFTLPPLSEPAYTPSASPVPVKVKSEPTTTPIHKPYQYKRRKLPNQCPTEPAFHSTPVLPPCKVCNDKATGFHYGCNTCEACKGFYRRSLLKGDTYVCNNNQICPTTGPQKAVCAWCRLQKCISVGMSKTGIKRGRYSLEKKTNFIKEVKRLEHQEKIQKRMEHMNSFEERKHEIEQLTQFVAELSLKFTAYSPDFVSSIPDRQKKHMEKKRLREKIFDRMQKTKPGIKQIYDHTSNGLDGRKEALQKHFLQMEKGIQRFVSFCKGLPGFLKLPQEDQVALVKSSLHKARTLSVHLAVNCEHEIFTNSYGETIDKRELADILNVELAEEFFRSAGVIKRHHVGREEIALLTAICVYSGDECPSLKAPEKVEELQLAFVEALQHHITKNSPGEKMAAQRLGDLLSVLSEIRYADYIHWKHREDMFARLYGLKVPPLILEIIMG